MTSGDIKDTLRRFAPYKNIFIPEFTWRSLRADVVIVDMAHRWIRGYEIKISRSDFLQDQKWTEYTEFCSSLSIVCPENMIQPEEIKKPFGLIWVLPPALGSLYRLKYKKHPQNFQKRNSLSWLWAYVNVLETELPRIQFENQQLREANQRLNAYIQEGGHQ